MDPTDKTKPGTPARVSEPKVYKLITCWVHQKSEVDTLTTAFTVKRQHKKLRAKFLKNKNAKLIWQQALENVPNLKEYSSAMDILSREWKATGAVPPSNNLKNSI